MPQLKFYPALGVSQKFDASHKFVTSPIIRSPVVFAAARVTIAFYTFFTLLFTLIWKSVKQHTGNSYFSYFTDLSYIGICAYYCAAATQTIAYALKWKKSGAGVGCPLYSWPKFLQALHVILQASVVTFPLLVTIVFWVLLAKPDTFATAYSAWSNISVHILNSVFALFEILFSNSPPAPWFTLVFNILLLAAYLGVAYITYATQGFYVYAFLNPSKQHAKLAAYIVGILLGEVIIFSIVRGIIVLRERWAWKSGRVLNMGGGLGKDGVSREVGDDEWEEIRRSSEPAHVEAEKATERIA